MNVVFLQPPEMISTGDEALAFNLKFGRYDGCFSYEKAGPRGEGFYVTDLGRSVGNRMKIKASAYYSKNFYQGSMFHFLSIWPIDFAVVDVVRSAVP